MQTEEQSRAKAHKAGRRQEFSKGFAEDIWQKCKGEGLQEQMQKHVAINCGRIFRICLVATGGAVSAAMAQIGMENVCILTSMHTSRIRYANMSVAGLVSDISQSSLKLPSTLQYHCFPC
jgi:hypothetical protein